MSALITLSNVQYTYEGAEHPAVRDIHVTIQPGEWVAVVGPGGSGKSTLCRILCGLTETSAADGTLTGSAVLSGLPGNRYSALQAAGRIGYVPQDAESGTVMEIVEDELAFGPENMLVPPEEIETRIQAALEAVGLPADEMRSRRVADLSGGQQQRIAVAAVHAMKPELLVFDDAAANLDANGVERLQAAWARLHQTGHALVTASPRWDGAAERADRVIVLDRGQIIADGTPEEVLAGQRETLQRLGCLPSEEPPRVPFPPSPQRRVLHTAGFRYTYPSGGSTVQVPEAELYSGEIVAVLGPNGTGKTTLGKLITGLLPAPRGAFTLEGHAGYVFQQPEHQFVADSVFEECAFGLRARQPDRSLSKEDAAAVEAQLERFGLLPLRNKHPLSLSVSNRRMLNLASSLLLQPAVLVLDEPTAGMDYALADRLMRHVADFAAAGGAAMLITHDEHVVRRWAGRTITFEGR